MFVFMMVSAKIAIVAALQTDDHMNGPIRAVRLSIGRFILEIAPLNCIRWLYAEMLLYRGL